MFSESLGGLWDMSTDRTVANAEQARECMASALPGEKVCI